MKTIDILKTALVHLHLAGVKDAELVEDPFGYSDPAVYVNFGHNEALVIVPFNNQHGLGFEVVATRWDDSHGVDDEAWVAEVRSAQLPAVVTSFLENLALEQEFADVSKD